MRIYAHSRIASGNANTMSDHRVRQYLRGLAALAEEVAAKPWLWPIFIEIVKLVPETVVSLARERRRIAA